MIRELDQLKSENLNVEDEQMKVLELIGQTEQDVAVASGELADLRHACSQEDMINLNHRKDIEHKERLVAEQQDISAANYAELTRLRDI